MSCAAPGSALRYVCSWGVQSKDPAVLAWGMGNAHRTQKYGPLEAAAFTRSYVDHFGERDMLPERRAQLEAEGAGNYSEYLRGRAGLPRPQGAPNYRVPASRCAC